VGGSAANDPHGKLLRVSGRSEHGDSKGAKLVTLLFTKREERMLFEPSLVSLLRGESSSSGVWIGLLVD